MLIQTKIEKKVVVVFRYLYISMEVTFAVLFIVPTGNKIMKLEIVHNF